MHTQCTHTCTRTDARAHTHRCAGTVWALAFDGSGERMASVSPFGTGTLLAPLVLTRKPEAPSPTGTDWLWYAPSRSPADYRRLLAPLVLLWVRHGVVVWAPFCMMLWAQY
eukprot:3926096-Rhodomonas_salina.2